MQGASPLASPGLNPGGTGFSCGKRVPAGACLAGCRQTLPFRNPRGACLLCHLLPLPLALILPPSPHPPSLPGKGEIQSIFRRGLPPPAPLQSGGKRHWLCFWKTVLLAFWGKFSTEGKDSNAAGDANTIGDSPCRTPTTQVQQVPHGFRLRGCKGRSPLHKITFSLPLPAGKGVGGMGAETKLKQKAGGRPKGQAPPTGSGKARSAGDKEGKPPHRVPWRQGQQATKRTSPQKAHI